MKRDAKIYVAGHRGLVGSALWRLFEREGYSNLLGRTRPELDLLNGTMVREFFDVEQPEYVFVAAAKVGGINANQTYPADFLFQNLQIQNNIIHAAHSVGVRKLLFLGSSCIYPRLAPQPMKEASLLTGPLEPTNEWYALAKIAGVKLCQAFRRQHRDDFISIMPTNLYGPNDSYDLEKSHVLPALIRRFHEAKRDRLPEVVLWGTGSPLREFLHVDDLAHACLFLMEHYSDEEIINVGTGREVTIRQLAEIVQRVVGYTGRVQWDTTRPDGTPRKLLDCGKLKALGWQPAIDLEKGIRSVYADYSSESPLA
jgi:GDP-L-fucose synthase